MLAYAVMGLAVFCMMQSLGEMATQLPIRGSFETYAERFIDSSFAFAVGWNYWFSWAITLAAELVAGALDRQILVSLIQTRDCGRRDFSLCCWH
jgi:lysine-specific permease